MLSSDLVFNVLVAATAFGAVVILAPSAARVDAAQAHAGGSGPAAEMRSGAALFAESEEIRNMRANSTDRRDLRLQAIDSPTSALDGPPVSRQ